MNVSALPQTSIAEAFAYCERMAKSHYENFTVPSFLLPREKRKHMYSIYAFCRYTDDIGDEAKGDRLALLDRWEHDLELCFSGTGISAPMVALQQTVQEFRMPKELFTRIIKANRMDQETGRFEMYADVLNYCEYSANPVGRMVLYLFGYSDPERQRLSDATCTALQLTNFWQDVAGDYKRGRIYIPLEDMRRFGYTEQMLAKGEYNSQFREMMTFEVNRATKLFNEGWKLTKTVNSVLRIDLKLFSLGGMAVLDGIKRIDYDTLHKRPTVSRLRKALLIASVLMRLK
ncbi:MAG: squalene synthase HpnC [Dehalococcoidia bacterium]|nr:squalene synthase HpnC [Dehalococcoidia bacterium]